MSTTVSSTRTSNRRLMIALLGIPIGMVLFVFLAFPPLYSLWCKVTGTDLKPNNERTAAASSVGTGRFLDVYVESRVFHDLPVEFVATPASDRIEVGRDARVTYRVTNRSQQVQHLRPIHQVSPINAARFFGMKICFCFQDQTLQPGETKEFPVVYSFSPDLDPRVGTVTLCYSLFRIEPGQGPSKEQQELERKIKEAIAEEPAP